MSPSLQEDSVVHLPLGKSKAGSIRFSNNNLTFAIKNGIESEFLDVPSVKTMQVPNLNLEEPYFFYHAFSGLMGYLTPSSFPLGKKFGEKKTTNSFGASMA